MFLPGTQHQKDADHYTIYIIISEELPHTRNQKPEHQSCSSFNSVWYILYIGLQYKVSYMLLFLNVIGNWPKASRCRLNSTNAIWFLPILSRHKEWRMVLDRFHKCIRETLCCCASSAYHRKRIVPLVVYGAEPRFGQTYMHLAGHPPLSAGGITLPARLKRQRKYWHTYMHPGVWRAFNASYPTHKRQKHTMKCSSMAVIANNP